MSDIHCCLGSETPLTLHTRSCGKLPGAFSVNNGILLGTTLVSLFADIMTILGIGGILTWGLVHKDSSRLADQIVEVFFLSLRMGLLFPVTLV
jgi:hypothetical protein